MSATTSSYRPPEELKRTPTYFELFGDISPEEKAKNQERIDYLSSRTDLDFYLSPEEVSQLQQDLSNNIYNDELYKEYDKRVTYGQTIAGVMGEDYDYTSSSFTEAKQKADQVYMQSLANDLNKAESEEERKRIQSYIDRGALVFDNETLKEVRDANLGKANSEKKFLRTALNAQALVMGDFLQRNDIPVSQRLDISYEDQQAAGRGANQYLNTGTLAHMLPISRADAQSGISSIRFEYDYQPLEMGSMRSGDGELGTYSMYSAIPQVTAHDNKPWLNPFQSVMDVLSVVYPPLAPVFQGVSNLAETEDLDDALKTAGKIYVGGELIKGVNSELETALGDSGINLDALPDPVKNVTVNTIGGVLTGQDGDEAFKNAVKGELTDVAVDEFDFDEDALVTDIKNKLGLDPDYELPEFAQNIVNDTADAWVSGDSASDAFVSSVESEARDYAGGVVEGVIKTGADVIADALPEFDTPEPIEAIGDALVAGGEVVEDLLQAPLDLVGDTFEPIVDAVDSGLDYIGEKYVDPALDAIGDALPEGETPEGLDVDTPDVDIKLTRAEPTQTESLFGDEIGKIYRTPIETYNPAFSQEEIQGMLQQRYRG